MQTTIRGSKGFEPTAAILGYAQKKLDRAARKMTNVENVDLSLTTEKEMTYVQAIVETTDGTFKKTMSDEDMYRAIDLCIDKITRMARKKKEKRLDSKRKGNYIFKKCGQLESVSETE